MFEVGDAARPRRRPAAPDDILTDRRVSTVAGRQPMLADAVNTELFITISVSTFPRRRRGPDCISSAAATLSRRRRTYAAPPSPQKAAEYVAATARPHTTVGAQSQKSFVLDGGDGNESMSSQLTAARRRHRGATSPLVDLVVSRRGVDGTAVDSVTSADHPLRRRAGPGRPAHKIFISMTRSAVGRPRVRPPDTAGCMRL